MTPKELLDTILGYLGFVAEIERVAERSGQSGPAIYTEKARR